MKRIISSALIIALSIGAAQAQTTPDAHPLPKQEHKMAFDKLNLSDDQKARLKSIREDFKRGMDDLKKDSLSAADSKTKRIELHKKYESQFEAVLTPAQKEQWAQLKQQRKENHQAGQFRMRADKDSTHHDHAFRGGKKLNETLGLTPEQQQKISSIRSDFKPKFEALRKDSSLAMDQKKIKMRELRKQQQEQMKTVLTPEQIQKMRALRKEHSVTNV